MSGKLRQPSSASTFPLPPADHRVEKHVLLPLGRIAFEIQDEEPIGQIDLIGGQADALLLVHQVEHLADDVLQLAIDAPQRLRLVAQGGMRVFDNSQHGLGSITRGSGHLIIDVARAVVFQNWPSPVCRFLVLTRPIVSPQGAFSLGQTPLERGIAMKVLLVRLGVLGTLVVLGWITMANAQRGSDGANPLRASAPPAESSTALAAAVFAASRAGLAAACGRLDPRRLGRRAIAAAQPGGAVAVSAVGLCRSRPNSRRPARRLTSGEANRWPTTALRPDRTGAIARAVAGDRYSAPTGGDRRRHPTAKSRRRFGPIRTAMPASPPPAGRTNRGGFGTPAEIGRAADFPGEGEGSGQPGDPRLEGVQSPQLTIQKSAPKEIQVGKPATFRVTVRNTGSIARLRSRGLRPGSQGNAAAGHHAAGEARPARRNRLDAGHHSARRRGEGRDATDAHGRGRDRQRGHGPLRRRRLGPHRSPPGRNWSSRPRRRRRS